MALFSSEWSRLPGISKAIVSQDLLSLKNSPISGPLSWPVSQEQLSRSPPEKVDRATWRWTLVLPTFGARGAAAGICIKIYTHAPLPF